MRTKHRRYLLRRIGIPAALAGLAATAMLAGAPDAIGWSGAFGGKGHDRPNRSIELPFTIEKLDGHANNLTHPLWGAAGQPYQRIAAPAYPDGVGAMLTGPNARAISNRILNDSNQNVFSERALTQWVWTWGQLLDHTFGLREETGPTATPANIPFDPDDPLETFSNTLGFVPFSRTNATPGTGTGPDNPRQQTNTTSSLINAAAVYGTSDERLDWLREGSVDGDPHNNSASLLLPGGYLPRAADRDSLAATNAPSMALDGMLLGHPDRAMLAGDVRANENLALTAVQTLFAREHNRIVAQLPDSLSEEQKFAIARRIVIAEQQYITYEEWLPALGVALPRYTGYRSTVNPALSTEFATVGYRVHSQVHGEFEFSTNASRYSAEDLDYFAAQGLEVTIEQDGDAAADAIVEIAVPLSVAFFNPDLLPRLQLGPVLESLLESQYRNDEQLDNQLRSVLFQIPAPTNPSCAQGPQLEACFTGVVDLGALDIERARDHGIPRYNALRRAYGLAPKTSFRALTGEVTEELPDGVSIDDPTALDIIELTDIDGRPVELGEDGATHEVRRTSLAARLKAIYGDVDSVDAFVGMISEPHVAGTELGELQLAIWTKQFQALRDGDRFFFGNDRALEWIRGHYRVDFRHTLSEIIAANTGSDGVPANVFVVAADDLPPASCAVTYRLTPDRRGTFSVDLAIRNTGSQRLRDWALRFQFANGQTVRGASKATVRQSGPGGRDVTLRPLRRASGIAPGATASGLRFTASWDGLTNAKPPVITLNNQRCAVT